MKPRITTELQDCLTQNPRIDAVFFEKETGIHHFNHVKTVSNKGKQVQTVNGKEVDCWDRKDVLAEKAMSETAAEQTAINSQAIAEHIQKLIETVGLQKKSVKE